MKKVFFLCVAFAITALATTSTQAQTTTKIGTFDEQTVLGLMPGIQKVDTLLQKYLTDSLKPEYDYELAELMRKDSVFKADSAKLQPGTRTIMQKEINQLKYKIVNWQQYQNEVLQNKQDELLYPYKQQIYTSLEKIIREQKYTHILKNESVIIAPPQDNLAIKVALDLKLKFPKEVEDQLRAQGLIPANTPATTPKPATKPSTKN